jgi:hypothetical protein
MPGYKAAHSRPSVTGSLRGVSGKLSASYSAQSVGERVALKNQEIREIVAAASEAEGEPSDKDMASLNAFLSREGISIAEAEAAADAAPDAPAGGRSQKRRMRGGDASENVAIVKAVVLMAAYTTAGVAKAAAVPSLEFLRNELRPLIPAGGRALEIAANLALQIFRIPITLSLLTVGTAGYTANVAGKVIEKFNVLGRGMATTLLSEPAAQAAAEAAVETGTATVKTAVVGAVVLNQLGLLPLSAVIAILLVGLKANLATGTSRAYLVTSFYAWYLGQPKPMQEKINTVASEYAAAAAAGVTDVAAKAGATLGDLLAAASPAAGEVAAMAASPAVITINDRPIVIAGKSAFEVAAEALEDSGRPVTELNAKDAVAIPPASGTIATAGDIVKRAARRAGVLPKITPGEKDESSSLKEKDWVELDRKIPKIPKVAIAAAAADAAVKAAEEAALQAEPAKQAARPRRGAKGGRKTKKRSSKRRVTRRAKPTRVLGTPVFVY